MGPASQELSSVHSLLIASQRSVRMERHTLLLMGTIGGFLGASSEYVIRFAALPGQSLRGLATFIWVGFWLGSASWLDHTLTRRLRQQHAESPPFAQVQITRAWWMLLALGTAGSLATFIYGGQQMIYVLWTVVLGVGIHLFGLFSRPVVEWIGATTMLLGVVALPAHLSFDATRWVLTGCCAIGVPLAGWLAVHVEDESWFKRLGAVVLWLGAVLVPAALFADTSLLIPASGHLLTLEAGRVLESKAEAMTSDEQLLRLEPGTSLPLSLAIEGPEDSIGRLASKATLTLSQTLELAMVNGQPVGRYRFGKGIWHDLRQDKTGVDIDAIHFRLEGLTPTMQLRAHLSNDNRREGQP